MQRCGCGTSTANTRPLVVPRRVDAGPPGEAQHQHRGADEMANSSASSHHTYPLSVSWAMIGPDWWNVVCFSLE